MSRYVNAGISTLLLVVVILITIQNIQKHDGALSYLIDVLLLALVAPSCVGAWLMVKNGGEKK
jgi:hypothetical protein